ncbi:MAG: DUF2577 family protein [Peptococcaceae bacterium]
MEGNPYAELVKNIREDLKAQTPVAYCFGTVVNIDPLKIEVSGTVQESFDLLRSNIVVGLNKGDSVLLLPIEDQQRFIILCKVVSI